LVVFPFRGEWVSLYDLIQIKDFPSQTQQRVFEPWRVVMTPKTILLCLNEIASNDHAIATARQLANTFKAHVTGLYVIPAVQIYPVAGMDAPPQIYEGNRVFFEQSRSLVQETFEKAMTADGLSFGFELVESTSSHIATTVIDAARSADLVVIVPSQADGGSGIEADVAERVVMQAGRPVLLLPTGQKAALKFDDVAVAWDGGREAARAAFDALPFLRMAKKVRIFGVDETKRGMEQEADIAEALSRQGVKTEITHVASSGLNTGETLLRAAQDHGAGLLVMGAYGHSRFSEFVFGGATRHVLRHLTMPVLMSH
jgi:nucleotide-binding universal stress UspA family protein